MIVRVLGEGQFDLPDEALAALNHLDDELMAVVEAGDAARFASVLAELLGAIRQAATPVAADHLGPSNLVLPAGDATLDEVRALLGDDGLIPG